MKPFRYQISGNYTNDGISSTENMFKSITGRKINNYSTGKLRLANNPQNSNSEHELDVLEVPITRHDLTEPIQST